MSWFGRLFGQKSRDPLPGGNWGRTSPHSTRAASETPFDTWVSPNSLLPNEEWARRLTAFAKKCAGELTAREVPKWQSRWPRGVGAFRDSFWVVGVDVRFAERFYVAHTISRRTDSPWAVNKNDFGGPILGAALLLTPAAELYICDVEMWFPPSGNHTVGNLDSLFHKPRTDGLATWIPSGGGIGRWRKEPDTIVHGLPVHTMRSRFNPNYRWTHRGDERGKGASMALSKFRTTGETEWPRWFDEYYGRY